MVPDGPLQAFLAARDALIEGASGGTVDARALARLTDGAVAGLTERASSASAAPFAIFALGGYGARRLLPHSDIDLLVISRGTRTDLDPLVRAVLYPLWDTGIAVGHQVRTPREHARAVAEDLEILTSFLTARFLAGDLALAEETLATAFRRIRKDAPRHLAAIGARSRPGSPYLLEPDLKQGAGGQRDLDELIWRAAIAAGEPVDDTSELVRLGVLSDQEYASLADAQNLITGARWRLHIAEDRAHNTVTAEGADGFESVQRALETVHHTLMSVRARHAGAPPDSTDPLPLRSIRALAARGSESLPELERAAWLGRLEHAVPGFRELMTLRRPLLSHTLTVGAHCLHTLTLVGRPRANGPTVSLEPGRGDALLVAALAHDLGKRDPAPGHAERGAAEAARIAERFGLGSDIGRAAATLVREHLLLADVATRSDIADEDIVLAAAARIGDSGLVEPLFLLTAADMRATGPDVWTPWRAALVGELASKLEAALSADIDGAGIVAAAENTRSIALRDAAAIGAPHALLHFIEDAPLRYLAKRSASEVMLDARLALTLRGPARGGEYAVGVRPGPAAGTWLLDVLTRDRHGLMATIAGVLALCGLDVLAAEAFTDRSGIAIDTFAVASATRARADTATWATVERSMGDALAGRIDLEARLAERRRHYARTGAPSSVAVRVGDRGSFSTPVEVRARDRVGLLHDLALAFARAGLDIRRAMVTTTSGVADDTFEITDADGGPPEPAELHATLVPLLAAAASA